MSAAALKARILRLERARPPLSEEELQKAPLAELARDEPAREAMRDVYRAFRKPDVRHENLAEVLEVIRADAGMSASLDLYVAGLGRARERLAARGIGRPRGILPP